MENNHHLKSAWSLLKFWTLRTLPMWCLVGFFIFLMQLAVCGIVHDNKTLTAMLGMLDMFPLVKTALGGEYLYAGNIEGLMTIGYKHPFVLFLYMFFAVSVPTGLLTGEVQRGTMELILSRQIPKLYIYFCAGLIAVTGMFALVIVMFLGTVTSVHIFDFGRPIVLDVFFRIWLVREYLRSDCASICCLFQNQEFSERRCGRFPCTQLFHIFGFRMVEMFCFPERGNSF